MGLSDIIAFFALFVSIFTFYWTSLRDKKALYLVRINSYSTRMNPEFALINAGSSDVLITSVLCAFLNSGDEGWYAPEPQMISGGGNAFTLQKGKSHHCVVTFPEKEMDERLAEGGELKKNGTYELYHKDMAVIVEWIDSRGIEHKAEPKIANYGFRENGSMTFFSPLDSHHDLYKIRS